MISSPISLVLRSRSWESTTKPSASLTICSSLAHRNRPLLAGSQQPGQDLLPLEFLAAAVLLHHHVGNFVDALVGGEALFALQTLAAAADGLAFLAFARIDYFVVFKATERALHG